MAGLLGKFASAYEAYNPIFHDLSRPVADVFGLKNLGPHFDTFVYSFILFNFANIVLVPGFSTLFFNRIYGTLDAKVRNKWYAISPQSLSRVGPPFSRVPELVGTINSSIAWGHLLCVWVTFRETDPYPPSITQELPWRVIDTCIACDSLGRPMPRFFRTVCRSGIWLG